MKCPIDSSELNMTDRQGIEIDYCPQCRGVWLDRGELDKIIERGESQQASASAPASSDERDYRRNDDRDDRDDRDRRDDRSYDSGHGHKKKKKEGFLGDLFEF